MKTLTPDTKTLSKMTMTKAYSTPKPDKIVNADRAEVTIVPGITLRAYRLPDDTYRLAGRNVTDVIGVGNNDLTRTMGVNSLKELPGYKSAIKARTGETFTPIYTEDAIHYWSIKAQNGNKKALALIIALANESLERRFDFFFGVKRLENEHDTRLRVRYERVLARQDWIKTLSHRYTEQTGENCPTWMGKEWTVEVNLALFNVLDFDGDRDNMTPDQQALITDFERMCVRMAHKYKFYNPQEIIAKTLLCF